MREAMFSMVGHALDGESVLDAFGGSGLLALEAWSRGARVTCVERQGASVRAIRRNIEGLGADIHVVRADVMRWAQASSERFDVVLVDPPYALDPGPILEQLAPLVAGRLLLESSADRDAPTAPRGLAMVRHKCYGDTAVRLYRREAG